MLVDTRPIAAEAFAPSEPTMAESIYCITMVVICVKIAGRLSTLNFLHLRFKFMPTYFFSCLAPRFFKFPCCKIAAHHAGKPEQLLYKFRVFIFKYSRKAVPLPHTRALKPHSRSLCPLLSALRKAPCARRGWGSAPQSRRFSSSLISVFTVVFGNPQSQQICFLRVPSPSFSAESSHAYSV